MKFVKFLFRGGSSGMLVIKFFLLKNRWFLLGFQPLSGNFLKTGGMPKD